MYRFFIILVVVCVSVPAIAFAQNFFGPLVSCEGSQCQACHLVQLADNIIRFLISIMAVLGAILIAWAGLLMATSRGNTGQLAQGKRILLNTIVGLAVMLAAWLIVDTIMKSLAGSEAYGMWQEIQCVALPQYGSGAELVAETSYDELPNDPGVLVLPNQGVGDLVLNDAAVSSLQAQGITVKPGASLNGLQPHVLSEVIKLNQSCNCGVVITEGTGGTHAQGAYSHGNGYKLDLRTRDNPTLVNYVKSLPRPSGKTSWSDGTPLYYDARSCATYAVESDHIDVVYKPSC